MEEATSERIISDPIYGRVKLPSVCVEIMDTMHFQRLRFVKCLGITDFVYPSGVHSRFTHSIGYVDAYYPLHDLNASIGSWSYKGRSKEKAFLYEIIANKNTGIDVDRFDYIRRDAYYIGIPVKLDVQALFYTRKELHSRVYQHKTVKLIHEM
ncbi:hypothetical protein TTRE_0000164101 [Trichuris trichiura]|uniref:Uncharacterized protein n=1 Tax=Trichuris trichiura TaxID=36087 RepID=A0A077YZ71_TRITR|nr:hypothetical protein TTRE_0000164101 [Trichuris trichiura]